jgi:hypothetical protein
MIHVNVRRLVSQVFEVPCQLPHLEEAYQGLRPLPFLQIKNGTESVPTGSEALFALI